MKKTIVSAATLAVLSTAFTTNVKADSYIVQNGDTLSHLALKYQTSVTDLKKWNRLNTSTIYINQTLQVSIPSPAPVSNQAAPTQTYTVVSGDTLSEIAYDRGISLSNLKTWNNITSHLIYPGDVLTVTNPYRAPVPSQVQVQPEHVNPTSALVGNVTDYLIVPGDTLSEIAVKFDLTVPELKSLNNLRSNLIYAGRMLKVIEENTPVVNPAPVVSPAQPAVSQTSAPVTNINTLLSTAKSLIGIPYVWGGTTQSGFDCSGFIYYVFNKSGKTIARLSAAGYYDRSYYVTNPEPGDLLFFENTYKPGISHIGIYIGSNQFIQSDNSGVRITNVNNSYYKQHFDGYKRFY